MRLFISYARVDKPYCIQIAETLDIHEIWYDQRLYAGQQWWKEILRRLDWCEGFVYLLSPESVASDYCLKEFELARSLGRHLFPILIHESTDIPETLQHIQYADLSHGLTPDAVKTLLNSLLIAERNGRARDQHTSVDGVTTPDMREVLTNPTTVIGKAAEAMESGKFDRAVYLLRQAKSIGYKSRFVNIDALLKEAEAALARQTYIREAQREYRPIAELIKHKRTRRLGCQAFRYFRKDFPDYDPSNLAAICFKSAPTTTRPLPAHKKTGRRMPPLPSLRWCKIPGGFVTVNTTPGNGNGEVTTVQVGTFGISQYPVTNGQYKYFLVDPQGYANPRWWEFSPYAHEWRLENPEPNPPSFKGDERPRENVTWYEAMAFCNWLSTRSGMHIILPTGQQWQRAAQSDDNRLYPWGNMFDPNRCNTRESRIRMTTLVMNYAGGGSPYGVQDMSGNVWEWCLNTGHESADQTDITSGEPRLIHGGSFISGHYRAQAAFYFALNPEYHYGSIGFRIALMP